MNKSKVLPTSDWIELQYKDIFNADDYRNTTKPKKIVLMLGGIDSSYDSVKDMVGSLHNVNFAYLKYDTEITSMPRVFRDGWALSQDINRLKNNKEVTCRKRLANIITEILSCLYGYDEVILVGSSHGCLILYSAIVKIKLLLLDDTIEEGPELLKKLRFYAITPPYPLQNILLFRKYNNDYLEKSSKDKIVASIYSNFVLKKGDEYCASFRQNMKEPPFFLQLHCEKDIFFSLKDTYFKNVAFSIVVGKIREKFEQWLKEIQKNKVSLVFKDQVFMVNENENVAMVLSKETTWPQRLLTLQTMVKNCYSILEDDLERINMLLFESFSNLHAGPVLMQIITNHPYFLYETAEDYKKLLTDKARAQADVLSNWIKEIREIYRDDYKNYETIIKFIEQIEKSFLPYI